ncbi:MAG: hypothetical protein AAGG01_20705 [Planctomycetota bacterium]
MTKPSAQESGSAPGVQPEANAADSSTGSAATSQSSQQPGVHNSTSSMWLVAGIPALLILAFLLYRSVTQSSPQGSPSGPSSDATSGEGK